MKNYYLYNAGYELIESMLVLKRWVHFRWAVVLSCFYYTSLFKTICYICDFFRLVYRCFCCVQVQVLFCFKNNFFQTDMILILPSFCFHPLYTCQDLVVSASVFCLFCIDTFASGDKCTVFTHVKQRNIILEQSWCVCKWFKNHLAIRLDRG